MARLLSITLSLGLLAGYLLVPGAPTRAAWQADNGLAAAAAAQPNAPQQTPPAEETQASETTAPPEQTPKPTAKPTPKPRATPKPGGSNVTPKPTAAPTQPPSGTPKPTIPPRPNPKGGLMPKAIQADHFARVVNARSLVLRQSPSAGAAAVVRVPKGQIVGVLGSTGNWYKATFRGQTGYGQRRRLDPISLAGTQLARQHARVIVVDRRQQHMEVYQNGRLMIISAVTTGRPELATPLGTMRVMGFDSPHLMRSPWPQSSPYWYAPGWAEYTVLFKSGGFYFHDTTARPHNGYGIGTQKPHRDPDGVTRTGSRGCVNTPMWAMRELFGWSRRGDVVAIIDRKLPPPPTPPNLGDPVPNRTPPPGPGPQPSPSPTPPAAPGPQPSPSAPPPSAPLPNRPPPGIDDLLSMLPKGYWGYWFL